MNELYTLKTDWCWVITRLMTHTWYLSQESFLHSPCEEKKSCVISNDYHLITSFIRMRNGGPKMVVYLSLWNKWCQTQPSLKHDLVFLSHNIILILNLIISKNDRHRSFNLSLSFCLWLTNVLDYLTIVNICFKSKYGTGWKERHSYFF